MANAMGGDQPGEVPSSEDIHNGKHRIHGYDLETCQAMVKLMYTLAKAFDAGDSQNKQVKLVHAGLQTVADALDSLVNFSFTLGDMIQCMLRSYPVLVPFIQAGDARSIKAFADLAIDFGETKLRENQSFAKAMREMFAGLRNPQDQGGDGGKAGEGGGQVEQSLMDAVEGTGVLNLLESLDMAKILETYQIFAHAFKQLTVEFYAASVCPLLKVIIDVNIQRDGEYTRTVDPRPLGDRLIDHARWTSNPYSERPYPNSNVILASTDKRLSMMEPLRTLGMEIFCNSFGRMSMQKAAAGQANHAPFMDMAMEQMLMVGGPNRGDPNAGPGPGPVGPMAMLQQMGIDQAQVQGMAQHLADTMMQTHQRQYGGGQPRRKFK